MKLIGTRIRVETSKHKTEYFPEYCLESRNWFGKIKQAWYGVSSHSSHCFGDAYRMVHGPQYTESWAKGVLMYQSHYYNEHQKKKEHEETKETTYMKYP